MTTQESSPVALAIREGIRTVGEAAIAIDADRNRIISSDEFKSAGETAVRMVNGLPVVVRQQIEAACRGFSSASPDERAQMEQDTSSALSAGLMVLSHASPEMVKGLAEQSITASRNIPANQRGPIETFFAEEPEIARYLADRTARAIDDPEVRSLQQRMPVQADISINDLCNNFTQTPIRHTPQETAPGKGSREL